MNPAVRTAPMVETVAASSATETAAEAKLPEHVLRALHDLSWGDARVGKEEACGCFYCMSTFAAGEIDERTTGLALDEQTALCPHCETDSVLVGKSVEKLGVAFSRELLGQMHEYWFSSDAPESKG